jgi:integrase
MAAIFKRSKAKNAPYTIQIVDHDGKRRTYKGFTDKGLTEQLAAKLEADARMRKTGLIDPQQDRFAANRRLPIEDHLTAYETSLAGNTEKHIKLTMSRVRLLMTECKITSLGEITREAIQNGLRDYKKREDVGNRTYNHYLQAMDGFCNWCVSTDRLIRNPIIGMDRMNAAEDVRHQRRSLSPVEIFQLIESARTSGERVQNYTGAQRARVYLLAYLTGCRREELGSLTRRSFSLDTTPPTVTIEAKVAKNGNRDTLPLHPELFAPLCEWIKTLRPTEKLFPLLERKKTWVMVRKDLARVGIEYETADGIADFHAAGRHTYITELLRNGVTLPEAKQLARHSDINMTMRYTHIGMADKTKAVAKLPAPVAPQPSGAFCSATSKPALHGRCISGVTAGKLVTLDGTRSSGKKRQNPCTGKGFGTDRRQLASTDKARVTGLEPATSNVTAEPIDCQLHDLP